MYRVSLHELMVIFLLRHSGNSEIFLTHFSQSRTNCRFSVYTWSKCEQVLFEDSKQAQLLLEFFSAIYFKYEEKILYKPIHLFHLFQILPVDLNIYTIIQRPWKTSIPADTADQT